MQRFSGERTNAVLVVKLASTAVIFELIAKIAPPDPCCESVSKCTTVASQPACAHLACAVQNKG